MTRDTGNKITLTRKSIKIDSRNRCAQIQILSLSEIDIKIAMFKEIDNKFENTVRNRVLKVTE